MDDNWGYPHDFGSIWEMQMLSSGQLVWLGELVFFFPGGCGYDLVYHDHSSYIYRLGFLN